MRKEQLYYHKTDGGAEYLTDRYVLNADGSKEGVYGMKSPTPQQIKEARKKAGLTQTQAAELIHCSRGAWQKWESTNENPDCARVMNPAFWELFLIKTDQL